MQLHANAALSLTQRRRMVGRIVDEGWSLREAAEAAEVSERTAQKWAARYRAAGEAGLLDRSSAPGSIPHRTQEDRVQAIAALRRLRMTAAELRFAGRARLGSRARPAGGARHDPSRARRQRELRATLTAVSRRGRVVAIDIAELNTPYDPSGATARVATWIVTHFLAEIFDGPR